MKFTIFMLGIFIFIFSKISWSLEYGLKCDDNGGLIQFSIISNNSDILTCDSYISQGMKCFDTKTKINKEEGWIDLKDPVENYYSNRSGRYKLAGLREVLKYALLQGFDPYIALAITAVESPQIYNGNNEYYRYSWGNPPVDGRGGADALGCSRLQSGQDFNLVNKTKDLVNIKIGSNNNPVLFIYRNTELTSTFGPVQDLDELNDVLINLKSGKRVQGCYFWVTGTTVDHTKYVNSETEKIYKEETAAIRSQLGAIYMRKKIIYVRDLIKKGKGVWVKNADWINKNSKNKFFVLSMIAQSYNGYGKLGNTTESVDNNCLQGMNMSEAPIYGAGVMHLALNMYQANSEIRQMVDEEIKAQAIVKMPSQLCESFGKGYHIIDPRSFANIQKQIMSKKTSCPNISFNYWDENRKQKNECIKSAMGGAIINQSELIKHIDGILNSTK